MYFFTVTTLKGVQKCNKNPEARRTFSCSTYGSRHMREVSLLVQSFDERIALSADKLYERFGRENGTDILSPYFQQITWKSL